MDLLDLLPPWLASIFYRRKARRADTGYLEGFKCPRCKSGLQWLPSAPGWFDEWHCPSCGKRGSDL